MTTDPVCGKRIDEKQARHRVEYDEQTYYFCSQECAEKFRRQPTRYLA
ncbi:MAG: YHS domain-containing protein [Limnochordia bacterium]|mgnify:CR=1 FL=1|jgi:YHS domain-containing protein